MKTKVGFLSYKKKEYWYGMGDAQTVISKYHTKKREINIPVAILPLEYLSVWCRNRVLWWLRHHFQNCALLTLSVFEVLWNLLIFDIIAFHFYFNDYLKRFRHKWRNILEKMWIFIKPGRRFGNPSVGKKMKKKAKKLTTTPIHHAPTHCGSEEVKSILI